MNARFKRSLALLSALIFCRAGSAFAGVSLASGGALDCRDCNVILISLDTLRADALGAYGSKFGASPEIDRAAERGFVFLNAYSVAPNTLPSHMSAFTGLYPVRHKVKPAIDPGRLDADHPTLAEILRKRGYKTAWAYASSYPSVDPMIACWYAGFTRGFDTLINESMNLNPGDPTALGWLEKNASRRFFLFLHQYRMHAPYAPTRATMERFASKLGRKKYFAQEDVSEKLVDLVAEQPSLLFSSQTIAAEAGVFFKGRSDGKRTEIARMIHQLSQKDYRPNTLRESMIFWPQFDLSKPEDLNDLKALYNINLYDADRWFGDLYRKLEGMKILGRTIIILMSDHGEEFSEHGKFNHTQIHEECLHVPLIFLFPNGRGRRVPEMASIADIAPTLLDALGLPDLPDAQGMSLKPLMEGKDYPPSRAVYGNFVHASAYALRDASYTYIVDHSGDVFEKLYDRIKDVGETRNLIGSKNDAPLNRYRRLLKEYMREE